MQSFSLIGCNLREETFATLGEWLTHPGCQLQSLNLSNPSHVIWLSDPGSFHHPFFEIMARQGTIKHLDMSGINFRAVFAPDIVRVLRLNTSLESCKLSLSWVGRDGMKTLTNALKQAGENLRSVELLRYREMLERGWTGMFVDALKTNPRLRSVTSSDRGKWWYDDEEDSMFSFPDPPSLIEEYHYYLSLNKAGRPYFYIFEGVETTLPPVTRSPLPLALWPCLLARAALVTSGEVSEGDIVYRMLRDGPLVQELRNLRESSREDSVVEPISKSPTTV